MHEGDGEWTANLLKQYLDMALADMQRDRLASQAALDIRLQATQAALDQRLHSMNEFRSQISDQIATFMPREEYDGRHQDLVNQIDGLRITVASMSGQSKGSNTLANMLIYLVLAGTSITAIVISLVHH